MTRIIVRNLTKRYGDAAALDGVSLEIESGGFLVLLGPSGCGKTTLLRCLAGLETPDEGEIIIGDDFVFSADKKINAAPGKRGLGMVFQSYALWLHMSVRENLKVGLDVLKLSKQVTNERLDRVLADVGLGEFGARYPQELSRGQSAGAGAGPAAGDTAERVLDGRTAVEPRRTAADGYAGRAETVPGRNRRHDRLCHP